MDFLLDKAIKIPDNCIVECYYFIDYLLRYVSVTEHGTFYKLCYVDGIKISQPIKQSDNYYEFDYYVFELNKPIRTQRCGYDTVNGVKSRVVEIQTVSGNPQLRKPKPCSDEKPITRDNTGRGKFF